MSGEKQFSIRSILIFIAFFASAVTVFLNWPESEAYERRFYIVQLEAYQLEGAATKADLAETVPGLDECESLVHSLAATQIYYVFTNNRLIDRDNDGHKEYETYNRNGIFCWSDGAVQVLDRETNQIVSPELFSDFGIPRPRSDLAFTIGLVFAACLAFVLCSLTIRMPIIKIVAGCLLITIFTLMLALSLIHI